MYIPAPPALVLCSSAVPCGRPIPVLAYSLNPSLTPDNDSLTLANRVNHNNTQHRISMDTVSPLQDARQLLAALSTPERVREVERVRTILPDFGVFGEVARIARRLVRADVGVVSLVDADHVAILAADGRSTSTADELPITDSFSAHCTALLGPVMIADARLHPLLRHSSLVRALDTVAFLGVPVVTAPGIAPLAVNVYARSTRQWTGDDIDALLDCAAIIKTRVHTLAETARTRAWLHTRETELALAMRAECFSTFVWDIAEDHVAWSENLEVRLDMAPGSFGGTFEAFWQRVHVDDRPRVQQALSDALSGNGDYHCEFRMMGGKGAIHRTQTWARIERDKSGKPVRMIGVDIDVTRLKPA